MKTVARYRCQGDAFTLVEVAIALGVAGFCLVSIFGLLTVGLSSSQAATEQTVAQDILSTVVSELRATGAQTATSQHLDLAIPPNPVRDSQTSNLYFTSAGAFSFATDPRARYLVTITFLPTDASSGAGEKTATFASIKVSWPAAAGEAHAAGSVTVFEALDRN